MPPTTPSLPRIARPDAGLVLSSLWTVGSPEHQAPAMDAALEAWEHVPWPRGLLAHTVLPGVEGTTLLHYSQWTGEDAHAAFVRGDPPERVRGILDTVPGIEREGLASYHLYRSTPPAEPGPAPGCIVVIDIEVDGPALARRWVDTIFEAMDEVSPHPGGISAHFHIGTDGRRVLNYAEWTSEEAHSEFVRDTDGPTWRRAREMPGVRNLGFRRYDAARARTVSAPVAP